MQPTNLQTLGRLVNELNEALGDETNPNKVSFSKKILGDGQCHFTQRAKITWNPLSIVRWLFDRGGSDVSLIKGLEKILKVAKGAFDEINPQEDGISIDFDKLVETHAQVIAIEKKIIAYRNKNYPAGIAATSVPFRLKDKANSLETNLKDQIAILSPFAKKSINPFCNEWEEKININPGTIRNKYVQITLNDEDIIARRERVVKYFIDYNKSKEKDFFDLLKLALTSPLKKEYEINGENINAYAIAFLEITKGAVPALGITS